MGKLFYRFIIIGFISIILSCSGGSSTQSVEDVGDDTPGDNSGGNGGGIIPEPVASFTVSSYSGEAPFDITFTSTSTVLLIERGVLAGRSSFESLCKSEYVFLETLIFEYLVLSVIFLLIIIIWT